MAGVTHDELRELLRESRDELKTWVSEQLRPMNDRLGELVVQTTATNGRLRDAEGTAKEHGVQLKNLEREVFRSNERTPVPVPAGPKRRDRRLSERDVKVVWITLTSALSVLGGLWQVLPLLKRLLS